MEDNRTRPFILLVECEEAKEALKDIIEGVDELASTREPCLTLQLVPSSYVVSGKYALLVLMQQIESMRRGLKLADKTNLDLLLRLLREHQISKALSKVSRVDEELCVVLGLGNNNCVDKLKSRLKNVKPIEANDQVSSLDLLNKQYLEVARQVAYASNLLESVSLVLAEEAALLNSRAKKDVRSES